MIGAYDKLLADRLGAMTILLAIAVVGSVLVTVWLVQRGGRNR